MWHIDPLLDNNETTAIARQQLRKYAKVLEPLQGSGQRQEWKYCCKLCFLWVRYQAISLDRPS
jgi:hypothetical protein